METKSSVLISVITIAIIMTVTPAAVPMVMMFLNTANLALNAGDLYLYGEQLTNPNSTSKEKEDALIGLITLALGNLVDKFVDLFDLTISENEFIKSIRNIITTVTSEIVN